MISLFVSKQNSPLSRAALPYNLIKQGSGELKNPAYTSHAK